ncbi:MAG: glycosyl transferase, partial [Candidatus Bipolaricaulota bacterium]|nr:glycosyl transferase [Candidatus Bipolaricaulota bacterium]
MKIGYFDDERREYVILRPDTPLPWINYLGIEEFVGIISNTAGGYAFSRDARLRRLTRYRYNAAPADVDGRHIYLRDDESGTFWSPVWRPVRAPVEDFTCRHGLGYTVIASVSHGIRTEATYFVPLGEAMEVWSVEVTNQRPVSARLSAFSAVEFCLWNAFDDATNLQRNLNTGEVDVEGGMILHKTEYRERRDHFAFFACSEPLVGYETQRDLFLGPYRGWDHPLAVERGSLSNAVRVGGAPIGAHHVFLPLRPGESKRLTFLLGYVENHERKFRDAGKKAVNTDLARAAVSRYQAPDAGDAALAQLRDHWERTLSVLQVDTPDPDMNRILNTWNPYQCLVAFTVSRSASRYETGIGRGIGFRDANQDLLGCSHMIPDRARTRILDLASTQLLSGGAYHQYQPLTRHGNDQIGSGFNDDPLWL